MAPRTGTPRTGTQRTGNLRTGRALHDAGLISADAVADADAVAARYAVAVTPHLARLMARGHTDVPVARDPIGLQYLPDPAELVRDPSERDDPIGDAVHSPLPGVIHRYPDRVLLMPTTVCPVYCRFCFRRESVGHGGGTLSADALNAAIAYIAARPAIREVILSGGDPLIASPRRLRAIRKRVSAIAHVEVMRIHTRVPVAEPQRITAALIEALSGKSPVYVSIHCNHPDELDAAACAAIGRLHAGGFPLLSQTVLLRGVNDDAETLASLFRKLVRHRVRPYYLHHLDLAPGTTRFRVPVERGQAIMRELRGRISGLCLPTYMLDIPGGHGKVPVGPSYRDEDGTISDHHGRPHPDPHR